MLSQLLLQSSLSLLSRYAYITPTRALFGQYALDILYAVCCIRSFLQYLRFRGSTSLVDGHPALSALDMIEVVAGKLLALHACVAAPTSHVSGFVARLQQLQDSHTRSTEEGRPEDASSTPESLASLWRCYELCCSEVWRAPMLSLTAATFNPVVQMFGLGDAQDEEWALHALMPRLMACTPVSTTQQLPQPTVQSQELDSKADPDAKTDVEGEDPNTHWDFNTILGAVHTAGILSRAEVVAFVSRRPQLRRDDFPRLTKAQHRQAQELSLSLLTQALVCSLQDTQGATSLAACPRAVHLVADYAVEPAIVPSEETV